ncbi:histidine--tRNA ligase [Atopobium sp. oral taxon 199]|uniref:histidine--tRNA ligase n=1 Tax=Atopobium sp. oral taxon 199 TaxID=712156 RepID=UPI00034E1965|nr:histidine--tRNA ligase [Atopobium sp. oral taxon 199]EPD77755.1 histidine-tRNA ligase [Atopobium sp. oral taxon 199 str. F0494]
MGQRIQGTEDLYGGYMRSWERMQDIARHLFGTYGFDRIETPAIEQVDTFVHGIGESTDVVRKEIFRVFSGALLEDLLASGSERGLKARQRMAMRPEGTAGVVRAAVEHNFVPQGAAPAKMWYAEAMFRGERPQKGRLRQFHQVGVEWLGASDPASDAESIIMLMQFFRELGFDTSRLRLAINSMGDAACRPTYRKKVRRFILDHANQMCDDCLERAEVNPLRAFDCKNEGCRAVMMSAPLISDNLCDDCRAHYEQVKAYLDAAGIAYVEDPTLVRGLDYYTRTVFEVEALDAGVGAIGGGGRYDGLMELEGGKPTPGVGFAVGFERIMLALATQGIETDIAAPCCVYVATTSAEEAREAFSVVLALRGAGIRTEADRTGRSLKAQFKQADKLGAKLCVVLGPDEVAAGVATLRDMTTHEQVQVPADQLVEEVRQRLA